MGHDPESGQFEWVNRWAELSAQCPAAAPPVEAVAHPIIARIAAALPDDQLMRDIAEIERARDALEAQAPPGTAGIFAAKRQRQALTLVSSRTSDPVPVVVGGMLAIVMLSVFGAAAVMTKFAR